jgi:predicted ATPase/DNA-binding SARP family transcriptional activator
MEFRLLGPLEVSDGDAPVPLAGAKQRGLLAFLLVRANQVVSRDRLIDGLWGDEPPETAVESVQVYVSRLRKLLPPKTLLTRSPGYLLEIDPDTLDLHRFERLFAEGRETLAGGDAERASALLRQALELWRGPALAEFAAEPFARAEIGRLEELRESAVEERLDADLALGRHTDLIGELEATIAEHPHRERLRGQLMLALYRAGRQVEALEAYRDARHALVDELGIEPGAALQQLEKAILTQAEALDVAPRLRRTHLPLVTGPLLGRETELARIDELLAEGSRLVTLTGPGGSGKTRLALQAAEDLADGFADGVFFVPLAPLGDARAVPGAAAQALGLRPDDDLYAYLASRRLLLVLDNAEHLDGIEQIVANMLVGDVVVLVTSRSPLHLSAELELTVEPLADAAAAELFSLRAAAVGRTVTPDATIVELCRRLDNLPLAVELAAARTKLLPPSAIRERLEQALPFLTGGPRDAPARQQTLRATIAWSYDLLSDAERVALRRLAVFRGSFSLDAAEAVAGADLETIAALVDKSLIKPIGEARFLLLETLREFALEQLDETGETEQTALRYARWYLKRLQDLAPEHGGSCTEDALRWYDEEIANTWAALDVLLVEDVQEAMALVAELGPYWAFRGQIKAARDWMQAAFEDVEPARLLARDYQRLGMLTVRAGDLVEAQAAFERALDLATAAADELGTAGALELLSVTAYMGGDHDRAAELGARAVAAAERSGDAQQLARARSMLALPLIVVEQLDRARSLLEANLAFYKEMEDAGYVAHVETNLAEVDLQEGNVTSAMERALRSLETFERMGADNLAAFLFELLGAAHLAAGRQDKAITEFRKAIDLSAVAGDVTNVLAAAAGLASAACGAEPRLAARTWAAAESKGVHARGVRRDQAAEAMTAVRAAIGEAEFEREAALGRTLSLDETIEIARELARLSEQLTSAD